ncbi:hypothetical protein ACP3S7_18085 [Phytobacter ursingii]
MKPEYIQYQTDSVARAKLPAVKRHNMPVKQTTQQKQPSEAAA